MKTFYLFSIVTFLVVLPMYAQVGIGTTTPDTSSALDVVSNDSGILIPRLLVAERITIASPAEGLLVYQTDDITGFYYYNGTQWLRLADNPRDAVPTGAIFAFPTATAPNGHLECDGSAVNRTTYADLFTLIGETYGAGDGSTTFNLPDYRGQFLRGFNNGSSNDPNATSRIDRGDGTIGDNVGTQQTNQTLSHLHNVDPPSINSSGGGSHNHTIQPRTFGTSTSGSHRHFTQAFNMNSSSSGNHNHSFNYETTYVTTSIGGGTYIKEIIGGFNYGTGYDGNHNHTVYFPTRYTNYDGNHSHSVNVNNLNVNYNGGHNHNINIPSFSSTTNGGSETRPTNVSVMWCIKY